ncbi:DMT family transporter [Mesorhizobium sp. Z1-4]|uniref:DMT family transporter n=1 Tax=Mesorhizobium sp. Z1-4 TaxID=2448478 RepID=UPI001FE05860|nr:DMT family transporter [Mesorhizobium sp. Z1-4]
MSDTLTRDLHAVGSEKLLAHLAMLLFAALVSGSYSLGAIAAPHLGPSAINAVRFAVAVALMAAAGMLLLRGGLRVAGSPWRFALLGALMAVFFVTMFVALRLTTPVSTGAVFTLMPVLAAVFGYLFLGQVPRALVVVSLVIAGCGAVWVIFGGDLDALLGFRIGQGELIFIAGVACHAAYAPLVKKFNRGDPVLAFTFWTLVATGLWIALWGAGEIAATDWVSLPAVVWVVIAYLSIFTTAGTFFLLQFAALRIPAAKVLAYNYLTPSFVILFEGLLGHGWAPLSIAAGAALTVLGLIVLALAPDG